MAVFAPPIPGLQRRVSLMPSTCVSEIGRGRREFFAKFCRRLDLLSIKARRNGVRLKKTAPANLGILCFEEEANHRPNDTRIAFWAETREQVDRVAKVVREAGGQNLEGPQIWPEYSRGYYAFFFEDPTTGINWRFAVAEAHRCGLTQIGAILRCLTGQLISKFCGRKAAFTISS